MKCGRKSDVVRLLSEMEEQGRTTYMSPLGMAMIACAFEDPARALKWLEKSVEDHEAWLMFLPSNPYIRPLRSRPGFAEILRRANLTLD
jgi:hypothetical protein